ncbi:MAG TPA: gamma-glutamyltransferase, partial [Pyrinomonadaceae bacterium]|nr:gamma-glutamyltransferase [Pyrinomonadaceae bacterium]
MFLKIRSFLVTTILFFSLFASPFLKVGQIFAQAPAVQEDVVQSKTGVVVSASTYASDVGAEILRQGGNAVDAAVATAFALAVTHPSAGNIGGGGFMIVRQPNGETITIDYREEAPQASTP